MGDSAADRETLIEEIIAGGNAGDIPYIGAG
jgi:hypothetical protein